MRLLDAMDIASSSPSEHMVGWGYEVVAEVKSPMVPSRMPVKLLDCGMDVRLLGGY